MKTIAGIVFALFVLLVVCLMCANAIASASEHHPYNVVDGGVKMPDDEARCTLLQPDGTIKLTKEACPQAVNATEPLPVNTFLQAITMDTSDGKESERHNVSGPWDEPTCWVKQQESVPTIQRPVDGKITVFMCTALGAGDLAT